MKILKYVVIILMLVSTSILGVQVSAHPPQDIVLEYDVNTITLNVTITHQVPNPDNHYIYKVEIKNNDVLFLTKNYVSQPSTLTFTYSYSVDAQGGDVLKVTAYCNIAGSISREITVPHAGENNPPNKPEPPRGEINGKTGLEYIYYTSTTDPEGDNISYLFDWGNGMTSFIMGPYESGAECNASNIWFEKGDYEVKVQATDSFGAESEWSDPLKVSMPKTKIINSHFLTFLENHPNLFPLLRQIWGL